MKPHNDNGTFFPVFDMYRHQVFTAEFCKIGDKTLKIWKDILVQDVTDNNFTAPVLFLEKGTSRFGF